MNENEMREAATELESYKVQLDTLRQQEELLRTMNDEYMRSRDTLINLKDCKKNGQMLVPIGANCFVFAKIEDTKKAISGIGCNIAMEESIEDVIERMDRRIAEISDAGTKIARSLQEIDAKAQALTQTLQKEYMKQPE